MQNDLSIRILLSAGLMLIFLMVGILLNAGLRDGEGNLYSYTRSGALYQGQFGGTPFFLFAFVAFLFLLYYLKEWKDKKTREAVNTSYHPLHANTRVFADEYNDQE